ncbi:MAG: chromate reductase [Bacteroidia bacterium]|jgi:chromate reductase
MNVLIISGSSRTDNNTLRLAKAIQHICSADHSCTLVDFVQYDLNFFNKSNLHPSSLSSFQQNMLGAWEKADLVFILSPEYNWFPSAELVNLIHQIGNNNFAHLFDNKTFAFGGVSSGRGGRLPALQLSSIIEKLISFLDKSSIVSPKKFESHYTPDELTHDGHYTSDNRYKSTLENFVEYNLKLSERFRTGSK